MKGNKIDIKELYSFILLYFIKNEITINHLKLQKILYYIQAWHLVYFEKNPLFDDMPEAWVNGPVYRKVYDELKLLGTAYNEFQLKKTYSEDLDEEFVKQKDKLNLEKEQLEFLEAIFKHYGTMTHEKLVFMTHSELPWNEARKGLGIFDYSNNTIKHEIMYDYYKLRIDSKKTENEL